MTLNYKMIVGESIPTIDAVSQEVLFAISEIPDSTKAEELRSIIINSFNKNNIEISKNLRTKNFNIIFYIEDCSTSLSIDQIEYFYSGCSFNVGLKKDFNYKTLVIKLQIVKIDYNNKELIIKDEGLLA